MSTETPEAVIPKPEEGQEDRRLENAGSTPLPSSEESPEKEPTRETTQATSLDLGQPPASTTTEEGAAQPQPAHGVSELSSTALQSAPPTSGADPAYIFNGRAGEGLGQQQPLPLSLNKLAIFASAQNKLPVDKVKSIVLRLGRHTESSVQKSGKWYKSDNYVDKDSYTWRNMPLFEDHQRHLWTSEGTVRTACKK